MTKPLSISEQLSFSTVRIECTSASGVGCTGTGFFFKFLDDGNRHVPAIITNKHVIDGAAKGRFLLHGRGADGLPSRQDSLWIEIDNFAKACVLHPDPDVDLCAFPMAPLFSQAIALGKNIFYITIDPTLIPSDSELEDLGTVEDILMVGYPNGIWDAHNNMPIMRRGITATHPARDYEGRKEFMIDAACFPGSSGSPVLLYNQSTYSDKRGNIVAASRVKLLGILFAGPQHIATGEIKIVNIPTVNKPISISAIPNNLGMVIKAKRILEIEALLKSDNQPAGGV